MVDVLPSLIKLKVKGKQQINYSKLLDGVGSSIPGQLKSESEILKWWMYFNPWSNEK